MFWNECKVFSCASSHPIRRRARSSVCCVHIFYKRGCTCYHTYMPARIYINKVHTHERMCSHAVKDARQNIPYGSGSLDRLLPFCCLLRRICSHALKALFGMPSCHDCPALNALLVRRACAAFYFTCLLLACRMPSRCTSACMACLPCLPLSFGLPFVPCLACFVQLAALPDLRALLALCGLMVFIECA